jgi:hopanoid biosynthesis associated RND transporter like protein HpnN
LGKTLTVKGTFISINRALARLVVFSHRHAIAIVLIAVLSVIAGAVIGKSRLDVNTDTSLMFPETLPWRAEQIQFDADFPQFTDLIVAVVDGRIPEEADATAAALQAALKDDHRHFIEITRPDAVPYLRQEGLLLLDKPDLQSTLDTIISAQPFLAELSADPSARGIFKALGLIGTGVAQGQGGDIGPYLPALDGFHTAMAGALAGKPEPLSWQKLLGGKVAELGGNYKFVLFRIRPEHGALKPGGAATDAIRAAASKLDFVKSGDAHIRITGSVALADDEFSTVAQGAVAGMIGSLALITLWLFLAVQTWRLIVPILLTLFTGLVFTLLFAALAVGTLNLVSVGFGILFIGIAVDFAIQFSVRLRQVRVTLAELIPALDETGRRVGPQILVAASATAVGFLAFVPTDFRGVAELGLIAGVGMIIAFFCTMIFLPAFITVFRPSGEHDEVGFRWGVPADALIVRRRWPILIAFGVLALVGAALLPRLTFDPDPLHTKNADTEAMRTLYDLIDSPVTNPFPVDVIEPNVAAAVATADRLAKLPLVASTLTIESFVPTDQAEKLALIDDAVALLGPTLDKPTTITVVTPEKIRAAAADALKKIGPALPKLPAAHPLTLIAGDLKAIQTAKDDTLLNVDQALSRFLPAQLKQLRALFAARPVTLKDLPPEITRDWVLPDGRARVQALPKKEARDSAGLRHFSEEILAAAPNAGGAAIVVVATADTIIGAFRTAAITALVAIAIILFITLRRFLDMALVLAPLLLSALLTVVIAVTAPVPLNFANIIALPLLLGVGVSFNIYFVMNWRSGRDDVLSSATARAILFSALTTGTAFGSLALSAHPGTASMGKLLLISLGCTLVASLTFIPALLAVVPRRRRR